MPPEPIDPSAFYLWWHTDERTRKRRKTTWRMQPADAYANTDLIDPEPDLASKEVRHSVGVASDVLRNAAPVDPLSLRKD